MQKFRAPFPKYIDKTRMVGPFEIDEAAFIVVGVGVMLILGFALEINVAVAMIIGMALGLIIALIIKGIKRNYAEGYLFHLAYIKGLKHPMKDNPTVRVKYIRYFRNNVKLMPAGYIKTLVE